MNETGESFRGDELPVVRNMRMLGVEVVDIDESTPEEESDFQKELCAIKEAERLALIESRNISCIRK